MLASPYSAELQRLQRHRLTLSSMSVPRRAAPLMTRRPTPAPLITCAYLLSSSSSSSSRRGADRRGLQSDATRRDATLHQSVSVSLQCCSHQLLHVAFRRTVHRALSASRLLATSRPDKSVCCSCQQCSGTATTTVRYLLVTGVNDDRLTTLREKLTAPFECR